MSNAAYTNAVKEGTFLHRFMQWNSPLETPVAYDFWCGVWLLSAAVGRRLIVNRPHAPVYLNAYIILCSDAGVTRKSTAVRRVEQVYRTAELDHDHHTVTANTSPEKLFRDIALQSEHTGVGSCCLLVSELITVLGREKHSLGMPGLLTDLYDCPSVRTQDRIATGPITARNLYVALLGASTPTWLIRAINPDVIEGGFTSRTLFVVEEKPKRRVAWPDDGHASGVGLPDLVSDLRAIRDDAERHGSSGIALSDTAITRFTGWYTSRGHSTGSVFLASFEAREDHHVLRLAALLACNERAFRVNAYHIEHAIGIVRRVKDDAARLFGEGGVNRRLTLAVDKLRDALASGGVAGIDKSALIFKVRNYIRGPELDYALQIMHELGMVDRFDVRGERGAPRTVWRATNTIQRRDVVLLLNERLEQ